MTVSSIPNASVGKASAIPISTTDVSAPVKLSLAPYPPLIASNLAVDEKTLANKGTLVINYSGNVNERETSSNQSPPLFEAFEGISFGYDKACVAGELVFQTGLFCLFPNRITEIDTI